MSSVTVIKRRYPLKASVPHNKSEAELNKQSPLSVDFNAINSNESTTSSGISVWPISSFWNVLPSMKGLTLLIHLVVSSYFFPSAGQTYSISPSTPVLKTCSSCLRSAKTSLLWTLILKITFLPCGDDCAVLLRLVSRRAIITSACSRACN